MDDEHAVEPAASVGLLDVARHAVRHPTDDLGPLLLRVPMWKLRLTGSGASALVCGAAGAAFLLVGAEPALAWKVAGILFAIAIAAYSPYLCSSNHEEGCAALNAFAGLTAMH